MRTASMDGKTRVIPPALWIAVVCIVLILAAAACVVIMKSPLVPKTQNSSGSSGGGGLIPVIGSCPEGQTRCSGACVDLMTDQENCGRCGFAVPFGETCVNGQFSSSVVKQTTTPPAGPSATTGSSSGNLGPCPSGRISCSGTCRDLTTDGSNCGTCGNICPWGQVCRNSLCSSSATTESGTTTSVTTATLIYTVTPELSCSRGEIACGGSCVDVFTDKKNCGVCGRACKSQEICVGARCGPACTVDQTLCGETCVDLDTDPENCGSCGTECKSFLPNAKGSICSGGGCTVEACKTGYADCDRKVDNGCEVNLLIDAANCGSCGTKCNTGEVCYTKKCSMPVTL